MRKFGIPWEKTSLCRVENQQTQLTYDAEYGNRTRATLVGGQCSHHCANPSFLFSKISQLSYFHCPQSLYADPGKETHSTRDRRISTQLVGFCPRSIAANDRTNPLIEIGTSQSAYFGKPQYIFFIWFLFFTVRCLA